MKKLAFIVVLISVFSTAVSQSPKTATINIDSDRLALEGYDPVSYIKQGKAIEGKKTMAYDFHGVIYRFSSEQNKKLFIVSPSTYLPQYGGWCAYALGAKGELVEVDPETFKIIDGKLYLFYNKFFNNTLDSWNKNENTLKIKADNNWKMLTGK